MNEYSTADNCEWRLHLCRSSVFKSVPHRASFLKVHRSLAKDNSRVLDLLLDFDRSDLHGSDQGLPNDGDVKPVRTDGENFYPRAEATEATSQNVAPPEPPAVCYVRGREYQNHVISHERHRCPIDSQRGDAIVPEQCVC